MKIEKIYFVPKSYEHLIWNDVENGNYSVMKKISMLIKNGVKIGSPVMKISDAIKFNTSLKENKTMELDLKKRQGYTIATFTVNF